MAAARLSDAVRTTLYRYTGSTATECRRDGAISDVDKSFCAALSVVAIYLSVTVMLICILGSTILNDAIKAPGGASGPPVSKIAGSNMAGSKIDIYPTLYHLVFAARYM